MRYKGYGGMSEVRSAIIAAFVAVLVAAPLAPAAADRVKVVVKKVTGKRGPVGPQGPKGDPGLTKVTRVTGYGAIAVGEETYAAARCPSGLHVISHGFGLSQGSDISVTVNLVDMSGTRAVVWGRNSGDRPGGITAEAICGEVDFASP